VWCHVCAEVASPSGEGGAASGGTARSDLFCERCGVALVHGEVAEPVLRRLSQLARFGVAGSTRRARRLRKPTPREG
jgi:hypothetical protein